ncbi:MAG: class I SAM-dependent methyltransferase, partial [Salinivenus sp.]
DSFDTQRAMVVPKVLEAAHFFVSRAVHLGDVVVDATVGNGHDTAFLAAQVGETGCVYGFDVQSIALARTRDRLRSTGVLKDVELVHAGHESMAEYIPESLYGRVGAVMFNLGYLPRSGSERITRASTTLPALDQAVEVLRPGGVITVVLYTGHEGGEAEAEAVHTWAAHQPQSALNVLSYHFVNQRNDPPRLLVVEKGSDDQSAEATE